ncbi:hypothetical protein [Kocuria sp. KH4]
MPTNTPTKAAAAKAGARTPTDRKDSVETKQKRLEEYEGAKLLKPLSKVPVWDQLDLQAYLLEALGDARGLDDTEEIDASHLDPKLLPKLGGVVKHVADHFTADGKQEEFVEFVSGAGAMNRALDLVMAYVGEMGEG